MFLFFLGAGGKEGEKKRGRRGEEAGANSSDGKRLWMRKVPKEWKGKENEGKMGGKREEIEGKLKG
ncbi:MAG: hypothetical protein IJU19_00345 [Bacteroidales bacterium]|nr:hypothetical protein [Bacteroidales bacterium]